MPNGRPPREKEGKVFSLSPSWSNWYVALKPEAPGDSKDYEKRSEGNKGFIFCEIKRRFCGEEYDNGIYELRVSRRGKNYVVYIGRTQSEDSDSLNERILKYCRDGSHISDLINRAMDLGYTLSVRVKNINCDSEVKQSEKKYLSQYDYAWNKINNGNKRENVPPP